MGRDGLKSVICSGEGEPLLNQNKGYSTEDFAVYFRANAMKKVHHDKILSTVLWDAFHDTY